MEKIKLNAVTRDKPSAGQEQVAAELYGAGVANQHLFLSETELDKFLAKVNQAALIDLTIDGQAAVPVLIREIQREPLKNKILHVDFMQINPDRPVVVDIDLVPVGKSQAISNLGATLIKNTRTITIECLPQNLITKIEVDLSKLAEIGDVIRVEDLNLPAGVTVKNQPREAVFSLAAPRKVTAETPVAAAEATAPAEAETPAKEDTPAKK